MAELPRVLVVHSRYRSSVPSGENEVVDDELRLLAEHGCEVSSCELQSDEIASWPARRKALLPARVVWGRAGPRVLQHAIERFRPDVVHVHNTFPLFSPVAFRTARASGAGVVHTLHNFRPLCPAATFLRDGAPCELCLGTTQLHAIKHACYRDSRLATAPLAVMGSLHGALGTWQRSIDRFILLCDYERQKYVQAGWPAERMRIKFNTVYEGDLPPRRFGGAFLCMSRIVPEKGVDVLLEGYRRAFGDGGGPELRLTASGDMLEQLRAEYGDVPGITFLGHVSRERLYRELSSARAVVVPSRCYEGFPRVVVEAYAAGVPVIASNSGSLAELVDDGQTGLLVTTGDADAMAGALLRLAGSDGLAEQLGLNSRRVFEQRYSPGVTTRELVRIYGEARNEALIRQGARR